MKQENAWDEPRWKWRSFEAQEERASDAVESGVDWKTVSGAQSSKAEVCPVPPVCSRLASAGSARGRTKITGTVSHKSLWREAVAQQESAEAQDYACCPVGEFDGRGWKSRAWCQAQWASFSG